MTAFTQGNYAGEHLVSEGNGRISREAVTIASGAGKLQAGTVLGQITTAGATAAAKAGNTGNGTIGAVTVGADAIPGAYVVTFVDPATNAGAFIVEDPDGETIGNGDVGVAFSDGGLGFTIADGSTDFAAGDQFVITVAQGSLKYVAHDPDGTDGRQNAAAVLWAGVDATSADARATAHVRLCEVNGEVLVWKTGISAPQKAAGIASLAASPRFIIVR